MPSSRIRGVYRPSSGLLHLLPLTWKTALLIAYLIAILNARDPLVFVFFTLIVGLVAPLLKTSGVGRSTVVLAALATLLSLLDQSALRFIATLLFAFARVSLLNDLIRWYGESIHYSQLFMVSNRAMLGREPMFFIASTLTAFPLIERDLRLALDAERLRLGHAPRLWMIGTWLNILINVLVRGLERAYSTSQSATERGFALDAPFTVTPTPRLSPRHRVMSFLLFLPPIVVLGMLWL